LEIESAADFVRMTRGALVAAGFVRRESEGTVWFETPARASTSTIVLVHGVNDQAGTWFTIAHVLARTHHVILPDLAGHGESEPKEGPLPISMLVERLDAVIRDERDITLVGNSLGGWLAMLYTLQHPSRVRQLVLEASGGLSLPFASPVAARNREEAIVILRNVHGPRYEPREWMIEALLERAVDSPMLRVTEVEEHIIDRRLAEIQVPVTLIWGAHDGVLPLSYAETLHREIAGSKLHVLEGAAHIPHVQQPEKYLACLTATF
jgi:pimeloyl-ACP methyl ester carboxylesterase